MVTAASHNPAASHASQGRGARPRIPQSMAPRPPLTPDWLDACASATGDRDKVRVDFQGQTRQLDLFFITGFPRSGTHWVGALVNLHPEVYSDGEFFFDVLRDGHDRLTAWKWLVPAADPGHKALADRCFQDTVRRMLAAIAQRKPGARLIGDRTPRPLVPYTPGARHIHVIRDGRDVLVSWTFHQLRTRGRALTDHLTRADAASPGASDHLESIRAAFAADPALFDSQPHLLLSDQGWVRRIARQWADQRARDRAAADQMARGLLDARIHAIRYEDLHADPEHHLGQMLRFLGVDPALAAPVSQQTGTRAGAADNDPRSFFRAGKAGQWRRYFTPDAADWFTQEAGAALLADNYEAAAAWHGDCNPND